MLIFFLFKVWTLSILSELTYYKNIVFDTYYITYNFFTTSCEIYLIYGYSFINTVFLI